MQSILKYNKFSVFYIGLTLFAGFACAKAATVSLEWNQSSDLNVAGYNIYYGTASGNYTSKVTIGNVSDITISNLTAGIAYYFAATAFNVDGNESVLSNEAMFIIPGVLVLSQGTNPGEPMVINFPVEPSHWYEVQASVDLQSWSTIWQTDVADTNDWIQFSDPETAAFPSRFYRLVLH
jgi:hypothetical protein